MGSALDDAADDVGRPRLVGRWSAALLLLAALFSNLTIASVWAWRTIASSDGFADVVTATLDSHDVRAGLADQIIRDLETREATSKLAVTIQPLLTEIVRDVVNTPAFKAIFRAAVREVHASFLRGNQEVRVAVDEAVTLVKDAIRAFSPTLANAIPDGSLRLVVNVSQSTTINRVMAVSTKAVWAVLPLALLSLGLFVAAVRRAPACRRAVEVAGIVLAVVGVLWLTLLAVAAHDLALVGRSGGEQRAVAAVFRSATHIVDVQAKATIVVGLVVAMAAGLAGNPIAKERLANRIRTVPRGIHGRPRTKLGVALVVLAVAAATLAWPIALLGLAARVVACGALVFGAVAVLEVAGAASWAVERDGRVRRRAGRIVGAGALAVVGTAGALVVGGTVAVDAARAIHDRPPDPDRYGCNGHVELCDRRLDQVTFAGTHNSMSTAGAPGGWLLTRQTQGLLPQLHDGVRALLLDVHYGVQTPSVVRTDLSAGFEDSDLTKEQEDALRRLFTMVGAASAEGEKQLFLCHNFCELGAINAERAFGMINDYLREHPEQVVLLILDDHVRSEDAVAALERSGLADRAYSWTPGDQLPTLREMIESQSNVVIMVERNGVPGTWYMPAFPDLLQDTPYSFPSYERMSCAPNRGGHLTNPLLLVNHWINVDAPTPFLAAQGNAGPVLRERIDRCESERHQRVNVVAVDFFAHGDLLRVVDEMNGLVPRPPEPRTGPR
jgi:hypothetical protein